VNPLREDHEEWCWLDERDPRRTRFVRSSTLRMRKLRARERGIIPGSDGVPCFSFGDGRQVALAGGDDHDASARACARALNTFALARVFDDPLARLTKLAEEWGRGEPAAMYVPRSCQRWLDGLVHDLVD